MTDSHQSHPAVVVDTNILMDIPAMHRFNWGMQPITVYVLDTVVNELRGLARDRRHGARAASAQRALAALEPLQRRSPPEGVPLLNNAGHLVFVKAPSDIAPPLDPRSVDHQQIALAQAKPEMPPKCFCAVVTNDQEMADIASSASPAVPVVRPGRRTMADVIRRQLARKLQSPSRVTRPRCTRR